MKKLFYRKKRKNKKEQWKILLERVKNNKRNKEYFLYFPFLDLYFSFSYDTISSGTRVEKSGYVVYIVFNLYKEIYNIIHITLIIHKVDHYYNKSPSILPCREINSTIEGVLISGAFDEIRITRITTENSEQSQIIKGFLLNSNNWSYDTKNDWWVKYKHYYEKEIRQYKRLELSDIFNYL